MVLVLVLVAALVAVLSVAATGRPAAPRATPATTGTSGHSCAALPAQLSDVVRRDVAGSPEQDLELRFLALGVTEWRDAILTQSYLAPGRTPTDHVAAVLAGASVAALEEHADTVLALAAALPRWVLEQLVTFPRELTLPPLPQLPR